jgi:hypothetical protein
VVEVVRLAGVGGPVLVAAGPVPGTFQVRKQAGIEKKQALGRRAVLRPA